MINFVDHAEVVDPSTVRLITEQPYAALLSRVTTIEILPKKAFTEMGAEKFAMSPIGSGAYRFKEWVKDDHLTLEANLESWRGAPKIKTVIFKPGCGETGPASQTCATGAADLIANLPPHLAADIGTDPNLRVDRVHSTRNIFIGMNALGGSKELQDKRVRQALNYAVDVDAIIKNVLSGAGYRTGRPTGRQHLRQRPIHQGVSLRPGQSQGIAGRIRLSERLRAGVPLAQRPLRPGQGDRRGGGRLPAAGRHQGQFQHPGVGHLFYRFPGRGVYRGLHLGVGGTYLDADGTLYLHFASQGRGIYYNSPKTDELIMKGQTTIDETQRKQIYADALKVLEDEAP